MLQWQAWLECQHSHAVLGRLCALSERLLHDDTTGSASAEAPPWAITRILLQRLYNKASRVRHAAAKRLVLQVAGGTGLLQEAAIEGTRCLRFRPSA